MSTKKYVSLDKLGLYDEKIKGVISAGDTAALDAAKKYAKDYADGLATNYESAGSIATAQEALQKNIDAVSAANVATQAEVDALETLVGKLPEGTTAKDVVDYVNVKTAGIATDAALSELQGQLSGVQGEVATIKGDYLKATDKTELSDAINAEKSRAEGIEGGLRTDVDAIKGDYLKGADKTALQGSIDEVAGDVADIVADYLKGADKTELEGKINTKVAQTDYDAKMEEIDGGIEGLQNQINLIMDNPETKDVIDSIAEFTQYIADHGEIADGFRTDINKNKDDIAAEVKRAGEAEVALAGRLDTLEAINHEAYVAADTALKNELNGEIAKKADTSVVEAMDAAYKEADAGIIERVAAVEALMGDGEGSVADQIADVKAELQGEMATAIEGAKTDASNKDAVVLAEAQKAATAVQTALDTHTGNGDIHVTAEQKTAWTTAAGKAHEHSNLSVLEGITAAKVTEWDKVTAKADATALQAESERAVAKENELAAAIAAFVEVSEEEINGLFA